ncbi:hypothetical protein FRC09_003602 [Ceratobasidium sp. 395]|nr:hypothetical protein FRC09_003602 [Ceratobasidium sp. 395]
MDSPESQKLHRANIAATSRPSLQEAYPSRQVIPRLFSIGNHTSPPSVQTQLDMATANNPAVSAKVQSAATFSDRSWGAVEAIATILSITAGAVGQASVLSRIFGLHWDVPLVLIMCIAQPLLSSLKLRSFIGMQGYYAMVTNANWLRMNALFDLGTNNSYKKEVLGSDLGQYINTEYEAEIKQLGDTSGGKPELQLWKNGLFDDQDQQSIFQPLPLMVFAYRSLRSVHGLNLSSLLLIQQASAAVEHSVLHILHNLSMFSGLFQEINGLYDVLDMQPKMDEGNVEYPEEMFASRAGMSIEFRSVCFTYPQSERQVLNNMSFFIPAGKLCVIVGENGCGKSTTVQLLNRLYDATSGEILIDGRPVHDFTLSSLRSAASVMYQDYKHLPLTVYENILLGRPDSSDPQKEIEQAAISGGAYNLIQKLPAKFETNLQPQNTGYSQSFHGTDTTGPFGSLIDAQKPVRLSGGESQRLAVSLSPNTCFPWAESSFQALQKLHEELQ